MRGGGEDWLEVEEEMVTYMLLLVEVRVVIVEVRVRKVMVD